MRGSFLKLSLFFLIFIFDRGRPGISDDSCLYKIKSYLCI